MSPAAPITGASQATASFGKGPVDLDPEGSPPPQEYFNKSGLYSIEFINAMLARQPHQDKQARKPLLAAKVYLESPKISKESPAEAILDLCEARLELVSCHLHDKEILLAESEALQILAACKKISNSTRTRPCPDDTAQNANLANEDTTIRSLKFQIRTLDYLHDIDKERGITARAARWRDTQSRLQERLLSSDT